MNSSAKQNVWLLAAAVAAALQGCERKPTTPTPVPENASGGQATPVGGRSTSDQHRPPLDVDGTLEGSAFIVTKAAESIKLGLVTICVCDELTATRCLRSAVTNLQKCYQAWDKESIRLLKASLAAIDDWETTGRRLGYDSEEAKAKEMAKYRAFDESRPTAEQGWHWKEFQTTAFVTALASASKLSTKTDADGKFTLTVPRNIPLVISARAQRTVGKTTEHYCWAVKLSLNGQATSRILLSNDNLIDADPRQPDCAIPADFKWTDGSWKHPLDCVGVDFSEYIRLFHETRAETGL